MGRPRRNEPGQAINVRLSAEEVEIVAYLREQTGIPKGSDLIRSALRAYRREVQRMVAAGTSPAAGNPQPPVGG